MAVFGWRWWPARVLGNSDGLSALVPVRRCGLCAKWQQKHPDHAVGERRAGSGNFLVGRMSGSLSSDSVGCFRPDSTKVVGSFSRMLLRTARVRGCFLRRVRIDLGDGGAGSAH